MKNQDGQTILIIGAHGMLGRPVTRRLVQDGFRVKAIARHPEKAARLLPSEVDVRFGDLSHPGSIEFALKDCSAVYVSVDTPPNAKFRPETDGLKNVIAAAKKTGTARLLLLSALRGSDPDAEHHPWWHAREKFEAQKIAKTSGLPWTIFEPTWFMESLPLLIKFKFLNLIQTELAPYWVAGDDLGRMISTTLKKELGINEIVPVQGPAQISLKEAARRFIQAYDPSIIMIPTPLAVLKFAGHFKPLLNDLACLFELMEQIKESPPDPAVWNRFGKPVMTIEDYAHYTKLTGDFPQK